LVFEIFDLKVADIHTHIQTFTSTDNKGPLKLSAREPTNNLHQTNRCRDVTWGALCKNLKFIYPFWSY